MLLIVISRRVSCTPKNQFFIVFFCEWCKQHWNVIHFHNVHNESTERKSTFVCFDEFLRKFHFEREKRWEIKKSFERQQFSYIHSTCGGKAFNKITAEIKYVLNACKLNAHLLFILFHFILFMVYEYQQCIYTFCVSFCILQFFLSLFWHSFGFTYCVYAYKAWYMATFAVYTNLVIVAVPSTNSFFLLHSIKWTFLWRLGHRGRLWIFNVFFVTFQWNSFLCFLLSFFKRINNENKNNSSSWLTKAIHNAGGKEEKKHFCTCCMCAHLLFYGFSSWKQLFVLLFPILKRRCNLWRCMLTLSKNKEQKKLLNFRFEIMKAMLLLVFVVFHF